MYSDTPIAYRIIRELSSPVFVPSAPLHTRACFFRTHQCPPTPGSWVANCTGARSKIRFRHGLRATCGPRGHLEPTGADMAYTQKIVETLRVTYARSCVVVGEQYQLRLQREGRTEWCRSQVQD